MWIVGAFAGWHNANVLAVHVNRWLADFHAAHARASGAQPAGQMLVRVPAGAAPGARLSVQSPRGDRIEFVVPRGAIAGNVIVVSY